jgi:hypothetical protein
MMHVRVIIRSVISTYIGRQWAVCNFVSPTPAGEKSEISEYNDEHFQGFLQAP